MNWSGIYTIWLRNVIRYTRSVSRIIGSVAQPLMFFVIFGFGLNPVFKVRGENYLVFIIPGIIGMSVLFTSIFSGVQIIWDRQFGFLKKTLVAPVSRLSIMLGQTFGGATIAMIQGVLILIIALAIGGRLPHPLGVAIALGFMFLIGLTFTAMGIAVASTMEDFQGFQLVMNFLVFPIFFLSGVFYPINDAPAVLRIISYIDPLTYGIEGIRYGLLNTTQIYPLVSFGILTGFMIAIIVIGVYLFTRIKV
jgi:ABC-2 type transport system permease protein